MKKLLTFLLLVILAKMGFASNNPAGNLTYKYVGTPTDPFRYEITVTTYTKWIGASGTDKCELTFDFGDGSSEVVSRVNGPSTICPPAADGILIGGCTGNLKKNIYIATHNYPWVGSYLVSIEDPNLSAGICNIIDSDNKSFYLQSEIIIGMTLGNNSGPDFSGVPVICPAINIISYYDPLASETDGDSLYYELAPVMANGSEVAFPSYVNPYAINSFTINHSTGLVTWDYPNLICTYAFAIKISEWRKIGGTYFLIGRTRQHINAETSVTGGTEENMRPETVNVSPNPSSGSTNFSVEGLTEYIKYQVIICNSLGQTIKTLDLKNGQGTINEGDLTGGIYLYTLTADGKPLNNGKFVILQGFAR